MKLLYKAIRTRLTDATLNAIVPIADISNSFSYESANYPCITIEIPSTSNFSKLSDISETVVKLRIYSKTNVQQGWEIYALVKALLHNQVGSITTSDRIVHVFLEKSVSDGVIDRRNSVWIIEADYTVIYSLSTAVMSAIASGSVYVDASAVTAVAGKKIADFNGLFTFDLGFTGESSSGQKRFDTSVRHSHGIATVKIEEVIFLETVFNKLWGITANASDTLADGVTASTSYTVTQTTAPAVKHLLIQGTKTKDGKKFEVLAEQSKCPSIKIPFGSGKIIVYDCVFELFGDSSDNVVKFNTEN